MPEPAMSSGYTVVHPDQAPDGNLEREAARRLGIVRPGSRYPNLCAETNDQLLKAEFGHARCL